MNSKTLIAVTVGMLSWSSAFAAGPYDYSTSSGVTPSMPSMELLNTHLYTLDRFTNGVHAWGPLPNPETPYTSSEAGGNNFAQDMKDRKDHLADVNGAREQVWIADARVRDDFRMAQAERQSLIDRTGTVTSIGATSARGAGGTVRFPSDEQR